MSCVKNIYWFILTLHDGPLALPPGCFTAIWEHNNGLINIEANRVFLCPGLLPVSLEATERDDTDGAEETPEVPTMDGQPSALGPVRFTPISSQNWAKADRQLSCKCCKCQVRVYDSTTVLCMPCFATCYDGELEPLAKYSLTQARSTCPHCGGGRGAADQIWTAKTGTTCKCCNRPNRTWETLSGFCKGCFEPNTGLTSTRKRYARTRKPCGSCPDGNGGTHPTPRPRVAQNPDTDRQRKDRGRRKRPNHEHQLTVTSFFSSQETDTSPTPTASSSRLLAITPSEAGPSRRRPHTRSSTPTLSGGV